MLIVTVDVVQVWNVFTDVVWHVSWSLTGDILAVSGGNNKVKGHQVNDVIVFISASVISVFYYWGGGGGGGKGSVCPFRIASFLFISIQGDTLSSPCHQ